MPNLELVTGILLDQQNRMLTVFREDHGQWELPGGKLLTTLTAEPLDLEVITSEENLGPLSLQRAFKNKLALDIEKDPENLPEIGVTEFKQGGVTYPTRWYQVMRCSGILSVETSVYSKHKFVPPLALNFLRKPLSPNIRRFQRELNYGRIRLHLNN